MADLIDRQAALDAVDIGNLHRGIVDALQSIISEIPSAQPEIIKCKDCKWWNLAPDNTMLPDWHRCRWYGGRVYTTYEDFCSKGERS